MYVCSLREEHRALARELGAVWVGGAAESPPEKLHGAIMFAPAGELVPPALRALEKGGTLAVAGIYLSPIPSLDYDRELFGERVLRSVTANTKQDGIDLLQEAAQKNSELVALQRQIEVMRHRPAQERALNPPRAEAQIWQWPINSINPANTSMYMFTVSQEFPGRGKRDLRAAVAEKDIALAENDVTVRARQIVNEIKQAYATLFIARKAIDVHLESVDLLRRRRETTLRHGDPELLEELFALVLVEVH